MKRVFRVLLAYLYWSELAFHDRVEQMLNALNSAEGLLLLPDPLPSTCPSRVLLGTTFDAYDQAYEAALGGDKAAIDTRIQKRAALVLLLPDYGNYAASVAKTANDVSILDKLLLDHPPLTPGSPSVPGGMDAPAFTLTRGKLTGSFAGKAGKVKGMVMVEVQYCTGDPEVEANWKDGGRTTRHAHIEVTGLTPGEIYYVRVRALGYGNVAGPWSDAPPRHNVGAGPRAGLNPMMIDGPARGPAPTNS